MADKEDKKGGFSKEQITMWNRWKQIINMDASELKRFRGSDDADEVGLDTDQAKRAGVSVQSGHEMSKKIERVIAKAAGHKGFLPPKNWTSDDWEVVGATINYISRARANKGDLTDDEGNPTPKKLALMLWGRKEKEGSSFPDKDDVKDMVNKKLQETKSMKFGAYLQTLVETTEQKPTVKSIEKLIDSNFETLVKEHGGKDDAHIIISDTFDAALDKLASADFLFRQTTLGISKFPADSKTNEAIMRLFLYSGAPSAPLELTSKNGKYEFFLNCKNNDNIISALADSITTFSDVPEIKKFIDELQALNTKS